MLQVEDLTFSYKKEIILNNLSFQLKGGQSVCLLGKNGVGKSTLFKCLLHLLKPKTGKIGAFFAQAVGLFAVRGRR